MQVVVADRADKKKLCDHPDRDIASWEGKHERQRAAPIADLEKIAGPGGWL